MTGGGIWAQRTATLRAMIYLAAARITVRILPLRAFRWTLGDVRDAYPSREVPKGSLQPSGVQLAMARQVERAAMRLPGESKCLAKAIALHWMMHGSGKASELVIAIHHRERRARHAYHAWLECGGAMLVGACERTDYRELMRFSIGDVPHRPVRANVV